MESKKVVEVPRDSIASPGVDRAITLAGLSPVKGAIRHSVSSSLGGQRGGGRNLKLRTDIHTRLETPSSSPIGMDFSEVYTAFDRFRLELPAKLLAASNIENGVHPLVQMDVH